MLAVTARGPAGDTPATTESKELASSRLPFNFLTYYPYGVGRGNGVGRGLGVGAGRVGVGLAVKSRRRFGNCWALDFRCRLGAC
jgi:hypothetical protein